MSSIARTEPEVIYLLDSDEEGSVQGRAQGKRANGGASTSILPPAATTSASTVVPAHARGTELGPNFEAFRQLDVSKEILQPSLSPWTGPSSGSAMLLESVMKPSTESQIVRDIRAQGTAPQSPVPPLKDAYSVRMPGSEEPLDLGGGRHAANIPPQSLNSRQRWISNEDEDDSIEEKSEEIEQEFRTGLVYSSVMMLHAKPDFLDDDEEGIHPEVPERISQIFDRLKKGGCVARMKRIPIREVKMEEVMLVHQKGMWEGVQRTAFFTSNSLAYQTRMLDKASSLYVNEHSARCARLSCGGVIEMCDAVASGKVRNGFAIVRPPGHHAEPDRSMGFCFYNNVAVAARFLKEKYREECRKILILDWDVHHGNGTQNAFYDDGEVLYISIHRYEDGTYFPGGDGGNYDQVGEGPGLGKNVNIPWKEADMMDADYLAAFQRIVMPIAYEFAPDLVIISAGFDAAEGDELGECHVSPQGYAQMTYDLASLANGKLVVALEGGYNLDSIAKSALSVTEVLLGEAPPPFAPGQQASSLASDTFLQVEKVQSRYWNSIRNPPYEAMEGESTEMNLYSISRLLDEHRIYELGQKFDLAALPVVALGASDKDMYTGQILCSSKLFDVAHDVVILFAHDAGNLRIDTEGPDVDVHQQLGYIIEGSSRVIEYATSRNYALVDVNIHAQLPTSPRAPVSLRTGQRMRNAAHAKQVDQAEEARRLIRYAWDNAVTLAARSNAKIILIGLGTATEAVMCLIEDRGVSHCVAGVIQLPGHSVLPTVSKKLSDKRLWYWKNSRVFLPHDHVFYTMDAQAKAGKRLGKTIRSGE
ncbi:hypothetical protein CBS101457_001762 [Exobasidium rhododendri]|nr:hypothetical protein CBS101457_001762 [Exobasidium rhododendri]